MNTAPGFLCSQNQLKSLRASYAVALQDREDAETQEALYSKRLDAEMHKSSVMKNEMRAIENSKAELHRTLNQLEADIQQESCSVPEHELMKEELWSSIQNTNNWKSSMSSRLSC